MSPSMSYWLAQTNDDPWHNIDRVLNLIEMNGTTLPANHVHSEASSLQSDTVAIRGRFKSYTI
jgi:hypothetical protein